MSDILTTAHKVIYGDREQTYGDPGVNVRTISAFWNLYINSKYGTDSRLTTDDVCAMMRLLKEARLINTPDHTDSLVDICGYAALVERIQNANKTQVQEGDSKPSE